MAQATPPQPVPDSDTVLCPRCDNGFSCGAKTGGCWCSDVVLDEQIRGDLATFYKGCLCPQCLQKIEDERPARPSVVQFLKKSLKRSRP